VRKTDYNASGQKAFTTFLMHTDSLREPSSTVATALRRRLNQS
jgi:hypothetical protein